MKINCDLLKKRMKEKGITVTELGKEIGINHSAVSYWRTGRRNVAREHMYKLCDILDLSIKELTGQDTIPLKENETVEYALMILRAHNYPAVVLCKDCERFELIGGRVPHCKNMHDLGVFEGFDGNWFCADGRRRNRR